MYKSGTGTRGRGHRDACVGTWDLGVTKIEFTSWRLCIKVGRGHRDACVGTWDLGTRDVRDLRTSTMRRGDVWDGDAGTSNTGTQGTRDVNNYCKSRR